MTYEQILATATPAILGILVTLLIVFLRRTVTHKQMERAFDINTKLILERVRSDPNAKLWEDRVDRALKAGEQNAVGIQDILIGINRIENAMTFTREAVSEHSRKIEAIDQRINGVKRDIEILNKKKS